MDDTTTDDPRDAGGTDADMRGPWALALGMAAIAAGAVGASALRRLARNRRRPRSGAPEEPSDER